MTVFYIRMNEKNTRGERRFAKTCEVKISFKVYFFLLYKQKEKCNILTIWQDENKYRNIKILIIIKNSQSKFEDNLLQINGNKIIKKNKYFDKKNNKKYNKN